MSAGGATATRIKICGIQEDSDAVVAAETGADFIGLVFVPGRRRMLDQDRAIRILSTLREKTAASSKVVGLFSDQPLLLVDQLVRRCNLDMVQLCGSESLEYCAQVGAPVIKVLHVPDSPMVDDMVDQLSQEMSALAEAGHLVALDRKSDGLQGGSGRSFNWDIAKALSMKGLPFFLAGGLTPENVGKALRKVQPWGVDVSSGVESNGAKDEGKIREFVRAVRDVSCH